MSALMSPMHVKDDEGRCWLVAISATLGGGLGNEVEVKVTHGLVRPCQEHAA